MLSPAKATPSESRCRLSLASRRIVSGISTNRRGLDPRPRLNSSVDASRLCFPVPRIGNAINCGPAVRTRHVQVSNRAANRVVVCVVETVANDRGIRYFLSGGDHDFCLAGWHQRKPCVLVGSQEDEFRVEASRTNALSHFPKQYA